MSTLTNEVEMWCVARSIWWWHLPPVCHMFLVWPALAISLLQSHRKVGALWRESGLSWADFLPEGSDEQSFIAEQVRNTHFLCVCVSVCVRLSVCVIVECVCMYLSHVYWVSKYILEYLWTCFILASHQKLEFTLSESLSLTEAPSKKTLSPEELNKQLEKLLLEDMAGDEQIFDWVEVWLYNTVLFTPTRSFRWRRYSDLKLNIWLNKIHYILITHSDHTLY